MRAIEGLVPASLLVLLVLAGPVLLSACDDGDDDTPAGVSADVRAPAVPSGVTATDLDDGRVLVSWRANRTDPDLAGYLVYRSTRPEGGYRPVETHPVRSNSWIDEEPGDQGPRYYRVSARDAAANESPLSEPVSTHRRPAVPATAASITTVLD
ncbi:MAG TPA: hypothetical protein VKA86_08865 [Candidatus Krumholzibacteria bacterium]|nr:hypothetical protein [Candidatus Krumholzibacteria bacterium]